jgi:hypothetical protein
MQVPRCSLGVLQEVRQKKIRTPPSINSALSESASDYPKFPTSLLKTWKYRSHGSKQGSWPLLKKDWPIGLLISRSQDWFVFDSELAASCLSDAVSISAGMRMIVGCLTEFSRQQICAACWWCTRFIFTL